MQAGVRGGLYLTATSHNHSNDRNGCGTCVIEAKPEEQARHHGNVLVVEGHAKIGEELNDHAEDGEIGNGHLQLATQQGVHKRLIETANDTLQNNVTPNDHLSLVPKRE